MLIQSLNRLVTKVASKATLRTVLILAFVIQIVGAVGWVGYLSYRNGQQAVNEVAFQLRGEISDRISDRIRTYLRTPHLINQTNADAIELGQLDIKNPNTLERHFLKQIQVFDSLSRIYFSNPQGGLISTGNDERGLSVAFTEQFARSPLRVKSVDNQGNHQKVLVNQPDYDARERPFYQSALAAGRPIWSPIYVYIPASRGLGIAASYPLYDEAGTIRGVLSSDLSLVRISQFLQHLKIGSTGKAFIVERSGLLVASSTDEQPFLSRTDHLETQRLKATDSKEPLIRATAQQLLSHYNTLGNITTSETLDFDLEGKRQFAQITPFQDEFGLDWLIVVVVPEAEFMEQINANTRTTIMLCAATLVVVIGIGIFTARWMTQPILRLNIAAKKIAKGEWEKTVDLKRTDEVGQLAKSFNQMARQLQASFNELTALNEALRQSDRKFRAMFNQTFEFVGMLGIDGILLEVNQTALDFGGLQRDEVIGKPFWDGYWWTLSEETQTQLQAAIEQAARGKFIRYEADSLGVGNRVFTIDFSLKPIFTENGTIEFIIAEGRDITEQKQAQAILADYNHTLEQQVAERTAELVDINEQLKREIAERQQVEAALRESEKRFQEIAGTVSQFFFVRSASSGQFLYVSPVYERMWGRTCESLYQNPESWMEALHPEDRQLVLNSLREQFQGNSVQREYRIIRPDGSLRWIVANISGVRDQTGQLLRFVGLVEDITERKQAEAEIIRSKDLLESIFNGSADAIFLVNPETLLIADCNQRAVDLFEAQSKDELLNIEGHTLQKKSFTPEELCSIAEEVAIKGFWSRELEYVTKKGKLFWGNLTAKEIHIADQMMHLVRVTDITLRQQAEAALQESEQFLRTIYEGIETAVFMVDVLPEGGFRYVGINPAHERMSGILSSEISGKTPEAALTPEMAEIVSQHYRACIEAGERITYEECLVIKGQVTWWITTLTPLRDSHGCIYRIIGTCFNISARKRIEEALRESALREQAIAHVLQKMRQSLDIDRIFSATTAELRQVFNCDRVLIYRFNPDWSGEFVAESVAEGWVSLIAEQKNQPDLTENTLEDKKCSLKIQDFENCSVEDTYLQDTRGGVYNQGANYRAVEDIYQAGFTPCYIHLLEKFQARSYIITPIFCGSQLWGLLATYQNSGSRSWSEAEISVVVQIGTQLGVALQQAQLLQQTQQQAVALELALDELKHTQTQLIQTEKMSSLGRMVAGVAHELNNPISFIYGNLAPAKEYFQDLIRLIDIYQQTYPHPTPEIKQIIEEIDLEFLSDDWQQLMNSMQVGAERIQQIVLSLRNFSRLDEQELKLVNIHEGIENTLLILQHRLRAASTRPEIQVIKDYSQLPAVNCYASLLNQVFMNLVSNAIDALEDKPPPRVIRISTSVGDGESEQGRVFQSTSFPFAQSSLSNHPFVVIRIADNGSGMSEEVQNKIFDPFFTTKPVGSGTGLGLSISHQIVVEKHKGQIRCSSAVGEGTEFIVEIPINVLKIENWKLKIGN